MKSSKLDLSGASLIFRTEENGWCRVELETGNETFQLGAESWDILVDRLRAALTNLSESTEPEWMLTLSENHCGLYRQNIEGKNFFFWIDAEANKIWSSNLEEPLDEKSFKEFANKSAL